MEGLQGTHVYSTPMQHEENTAALASAIRPVPKTPRTLSDNLATKTLSSGAQEARLSATKGSLSCQKL